MSKDVWHTVDETPKPYEDVAFYVDGYLYFSSYEPQYNQYGIFGADKVEKWCYVKELSSYILVLEAELECTRKALEWGRHFLKEIRLRYLIEKDEPSRQNKWRDTALYMYNCAESFFDDYDKTALEQKDE